MSTLKSSADFHRGYWKAADDMLSKFNSFDSQDMDGRKVRAELYGFLMDLRPKE